MSYFIELQTPEEIEIIKEKSLEKPQVIFKHSTRCSISSMALYRLNKENIQTLNAEFYLVNIIRHRDISYKIQHDFKVVHESPQLLIIFHGKCIYHESHGAICLEEIERILTGLYTNI
ncbi:MAG: bacillithiol system redox-active protein YtxJ [Bacteroidetes bacterium]|nr:bacillithiol system redox-active protein YtxJ [Bacteroidota bacterium]